MIVDASVILCAFFPDEAQAQAQAVLHDHVLGRVQLRAPDLLLYELTNAVWQAERRGRVAAGQADEILQAMERLQIALLPVQPQAALTLARQFNRSAYDAAYLALAQQHDQPLITADLRLYHAVHPRLAWVQWIGEYFIQSET